MILRYQLLLHKWPQQQLTWLFCFALSQTEPFVLTACEAWALILSMVGDGGYDYMWGFCLSVFFQCLIHSEHGPVDVQLSWSPYTGEVKLVRHRVYVIHLAVLLTDRRLEIGSIQCLNYGRYSQTAYKRGNICFPPTVCIRSTFLYATGQNFTLCKLYTIQHI